MKCMNFIHEFVELFWAGKLSFLSMRLLNNISLLLLDYLYINQIHSIENIN